MIPKIENMKHNSSNHKLFLILTMILLIHCKRNTASINLDYPIEVHLIVDTFEQFGPYLSQFGPNFILSVKNIGSENIVFYEAQQKGSKSSFASMNSVYYFSGDIESLEDLSGFIPISELFGFYPKEDTIISNQQKKFLLEPKHGTIFRNHVDYILLSLPITSPYFDSLNKNIPFIYNKSDLKKYSKITSNYFTDNNIYHPFFVFSVRDSLNLKEVTDVFIEKSKLIKRKKIEQ